MTGLSFQPDTSRTCKIHNTKMVGSQRFFFHERFLHQVDRIAKEVGVRISELAQKNKTQMMTE